jgi:hypothetical protein
MFSTLVMVLVYRDESAIVMPKKNAPVAPQVRAGGILGLAAQWMD